MQTRTDQNQPSLPQILHALVLALGPFIEAILADAARQGRENTPQMRRLARILTGFRVLASIFGMPAPTPGPRSPDSPARKPRPARPAPRAPRRSATRARTTPAHTTMPPHTPHPRITPPPWRALQA